MAEGNQSPPKAEVDDSPLQQSMDRNKESLKLKLLLRRPYPQLAAQGLVPPQKTPPAYHEQAKQLERRKTGDLLKAKIQQRPNREELVRQHILEDIGHVDPSLAERQRMLKKARLADQLNDQLSHRPGPLELIQKNILHTEEPIERAVKEGHIPFKATCEGQLTKPQHPDHYITFEDDSQSSEGGAPSPPQEAPGSSSSTSATASATTVAATTTTPAATPAPGATAEPAAAATATTTSSTTSAAPTSASGAGIAEAVPASGDVLEAAATSAGIVVSLSIPTSDGAAVVVTSSSPVFQKQQAAAAASGAQQPGLLGQAAGPDTPTIQSFAELCNSVAAGQELQGQQQAQHVTAQVAADSPLLISIASPASSMSSTTTLLPLAPAPSPMSLGSTTSSLSPLSNISIASPPAPPAAITPRPQPSPIAAAATSAGQQQQQQRSDAPGKDKNRKKSKTKSQPKTRTIKFHEYKGPPNAQKSGASSSTAGLGSAHQGETSYELLLQQQQLFLQWQVEINNKGSGPIHQPRMFPQLILPAQNKIPLTANSVASDSGSIVSVPSPASSNASSNPSEQPPLRPLGKLEDMKVSDLKVELKRRNLPVSGSKPQLIERLKPFTETSNNNMGSGTNVTQMGHILMDVPAPMSTDESNSHKGPNSPKDESMTSPRTGSPHGSEKEESSSPPGDVMLKEHYRKKIEELQRELLKVRSQQQFHQLQQNQPVRAEKLVLQQHLQNKMHQQQLTRQIQRLHQQQVQHQQQQQQHQQQQAQQQAQQLAAFQQLNAKASLAAFLQAQPNNATATAIFDSATLTAINNKKNQSKSNGTTTTVQVPTAIVLNLAKPTKINGSILGALVAAQAQSNQHIVASADDGKPPPPQYDEAAKLVKVKIEPLQKDPVKSQMVDDVLEILINSGELPPSAAHEPVTPTTPNRQIAPSLVLSAPADSPTQSLVFTAAPSPMDVTQSDCGSPAPQAQAAVAPPPPPPLPLPTFSIQLPSALQQQQQQDKLTSFTADLLSSDSDLESAMLLSPQSVQQGSPDPQPPQEVTSTNLDLRELGLDLDTMDFGQLDCDFGVKMETPQEFMDIGDMPMDMDEPDWLESLMPQSPGASVSASATSTALTTTTTTSSNSESASISTSQNTSASSPQASSNDLYDPLLGNSQDPFDLFNIEDPDFKMTSDLSLPWDNGQVDFAT